jgi:hypothetical protein
LDHVAAIQSDKREVGGARTAEVQENKGIISPIKQLDNDPLNLYTGRDFRRSAGATFQPVFRKPGRRMNRPLKRWLVERAVRLD